MVPTVLSIRLFVSKSVEQGVNDELVVSSERIQHFVAFYVCQGFLGLISSEVEDVTRIVLHLLLHLTVTVVV